MKDKLSPKVVLTLTAVAVAAAVLIGWFGLVSPQRSKASSLDRRSRRLRPSSSSPRPVHVRLDGRRWAPLSGR